MRFVIEENVNGDFFTEELKALTLTEAIEEARIYWNGLTRHDQNKRNDFLLAGFANHDLTICPEVVLTLEEVLNHE